MKWQTRWSRNEHITIEPFHFRTQFRALCACARIHFTWHSIQWKWTYRRQCNARQWGNNSVRKKWKRRERSRREKKKMLTKTGLTKRTIHSHESLTGWKPLHIWLQLNLLFLEATSWAKSWSEKKKRNRSIRIRKKNHEMYLPFVYLHVDHRWTNFDPTFLAAYIVCLCLLCRHCNFIKYMKETLSTEKK